MTNVQDNELIIVTGGTGLKIGHLDGGGKVNNPGKGNGGLEASEGPDDGTGGGTTGVDYDAGTDGTESQSTGLG